jgi:tetratricopeptide (TPR) repeat protein
MLGQKKKLSKKEIKQDKLVEFYYKAQDFIRENQKKVIIYLGAFVGVVLLVIFYSNYRSSKNQEAGELLSKVMDLYDAGSYLEAIEGKQGTPRVIGLKEIVAEYGSTENGETAKIYLANSYAFLGQYDKALKYYEDYSGSNDFLKATALAGQAAYYSVKKDYQKAAKLYKQAAFVSEINPNRPDYLLQAGINFMKINENEEAKSLFQIIKDDYKASNAHAQVDRYFLELN